MVQFLLETIRITALMKFFGMISQLKVMVP